MLVDLAWERQKLGPVVLELKGTLLPEKTIDSMLLKCMDSQDAGLLRSVESLARAQRSILPDSTYSLLIEATLFKPLYSRGLVEEVLAREGTVFSADLASAVMKFCSTS